MSTFLQAAPTRAADQAPAVTANRSVLLNIWEDGGSQVRSEAEAALTGTDEQVLAFFTDGYAKAQRADERDAMTGIIVEGGPSVRAAAQRALAAADAGDATALSRFIDGGWQNAANIDLRLQVNQLQATGGDQVREAAQKALDSEDPQVLRDFLDSGWQKQWQTDQRMRVNQAHASGGNEVKSVSQRALDDGSPEALDQFLTYGWDVASARDDETTALQGLLDQAEATEQVVERETANAKEEGQRAADGAAAARRSAEEAAAATADARTDAKRAAMHAKRAATASRKAAQSAQVAVDAAAAANRAARTASIAASRASRAAAQAANAASRAYQAAAKAGLDRSTVANARVVAEQANQIAQSTEELARKAGQAAEAIAAGTMAIDAAKDAAKQARLAADANNQAVAYAKQAGADTTEAVQAAKIAQANADRATRAANAAAAYMQEAITNAYASRDAAYAAAADARKAAAAAIDAVEHAVDATEAAKRATQHAESAVVAANKVVSLSEQSVKLYDAARKAEAERLAVATDEALEKAREGNTAYEEQLRQANWDTQQAALRDAETNRLIAEALSPTTAPQAAVAAARKAELAMATRPGVWTSQGARDALSGDDAAALEFLRTGLAAAEAQDDRIAVTEIATSENAALASAAEQALAGTDAVVSQFLKTQNYPGRYNQDRTAVNQVLAAAKANQRTVTAQKAQAALDAESLPALREFLSTGQYTASAIDDRVQANQIIANPDSGPELKAAAQVALDGPPLALKGFLDAGRYSAIERDNDTAIHLAVVSGLIEKINEVATRAVQQAQEAQSTAAKARGDATAANNYAAQAIKSANDAAAYADKAKKQADKAAVSAQNAAASASTARNAATRANASARSAVRSASWAILSHQQAVNSARDAHRAAETAKTLAEDAGKDAEATRQAALSAHKEWRTKFNSELQACHVKFANKTTLNFEDILDENKNSTYTNCVANVVGDPHEMGRRAYINSATCDQLYPQGGQLYQNCIHNTLNPEFGWMQKLEFLQQATTTVTAAAIPGLASLSALCVISVVCATVVGTLLGIGDVGLNVYRLIKGDQTLAETLLNVGKSVVETIVFNGVAKMVGVTFRGLKAIYIANKAAKRAEEMLDATKLRRLNIGRWVGCVINRPNSFSPDTRVLLADGTTEPISRIQVGDKVLASDPVTGITSGMPVTDLITSADTELTDVTLRQPDGSTAVLHTTAHHPFWNAGLRGWTDAGDLKSDAKVSLPDGQTTEVVESHTFPGRRTMYNLSVAKLSTYFVLAGDTPVLVHNSPRDPDCTDLVLGLNAPLGGLGSDALAKLLRDSKGIPAVTYNRRLGEIDPLNGLPMWMNYVLSAIKDPDTKLYITLDGLDGGAENMTDAQVAFAKFQSSVLKGNNCTLERVAANKDSGTDWEMSNLAKAFAWYDRQVSSVRWYLNGKDVSDELRKLLPNTEEEWNDLRLGRYRP